MPLNTSTGESSRRAASSTASATRSTGADSPVKADASISTRAGQQPGVGRDPVALGQHEHVAGDELGGRHDRTTPSAANWACGGR